MPSADLTAVEVVHISRAEAALAEDQIDHHTSRVMVSLLFAWLATTAAVTPVTVGDPIVDGAHIQPFVGEFSVTTSGPDGKTVDAGTWIDRVEFVDLNGVRVLKREQICNAPRPRQSQLFTQFMDAKTLQPLISLSAFADGSWYRREYSGSEMTKRELSPQNGFQMTEREVAFGQPVFDFYGGAFGLLLASLPLEVGRSYRFPVYTERDDAPFVETLTASITGREVIAAGRFGRIDTFVMELDAKQGHFTLWLTRALPYVARLKLVGPRGGTLLLSMPEPGK